MAGRSWRRFHHAADHAGRRGRDAPHCAHPHGRRGARDGAGPGLAGGSKAGLYDLYGLTETGSCDFCLAPADSQRVPGASGRRPRACAFDLAEDGRPAPEGSPGELEIRTPFGMLGYLDDEPLTVGLLRRLFQDGRSRPPAPGRPGRTCRTLEGNHLARRQQDRAAEIDESPLRSPGVAEPCAPAFPTRVSAKRSTPWWFRSQAALTGEALRRWASERTERYKVPDAIHVRKALPVGNTGKASRSAVSMMFASPAQSSV